VLWVKCFSAVAAVDCSHLSYDGHVEEGLSSMQHEISGYWKFGL